MQLGTGRGRAACGATPALAQTPRTAAGTMNTVESSQRQRPALRGTVQGDT